MRDPLIAPQALVQALQPLSTLLHLKTFPLHAHEILISWAAYHVIQTAVPPRLSEWLFPETYHKWPERTKVNCNGRIVSFIQSSLICTAALYLILNDTERAGMDWKGRIWGYTRAGGMVQGFAVGYFMWDIVVSTRYLSVLGPGALAHAVSALLITSLGFHPFANYYGLNFILYNLSTPFLSIHWLFDKLNMTGSCAQLYNGIALLSTFFCSRVLWGNHQSYWIYRDVWTALHSKNLAAGNDAVFDYLATGGERTLALPLWLVVVYLGSNTVLNFLNQYWFGKMVQTVRKRFQPRAKSQ